MRKLLLACFIWYLIVSLFSKEETDKDLIINEGDPAIINYYNPNDTFPGRQVEYKGFKGKIISVEN